MTCEISNLDEIKKCLESSYKLTLCHYDPSSSSSYSSYYSSSSYYSLLFYLISFILIFAILCRLLLNSGYNKGNLLSEQEIKKLNGFKTYQSE